jgi:hypothetical protein
MLWKNSFWNNGANWLKTSFKFLFILLFNLTDLHSLSWYKNGETVSIVVRSFPNPLTFTKIRSQCALLLLHLTYTGRKNTRIYSFSIWHRCVTLKYAHIERVYIIRKNCILFWKRIFCTTWLHLKMLRACHEVTENSTVAFFSLKTLWNLILPNANQNLFSNPTLFHVKNVSWS